MIKLACATLSMEGFGETDFNKTFSQAVEIGYKCLEFNCWHPSTFSPGMIRSLKDRCILHNLEPMAIHLNSGFGGNSIKDFCHKAYAMQAVKQLGGSMIVSSGAARGEDGGIDGVIRSLKALIPVAEDLDVLISLENHAMNNLENIEDYRRVFDAIGSRYVGLCIDTGHFEAAGVNLDEVVDEFHTRVNHIHLKENKTFGIKEFARFGEGTTDNKRVVERMIARGYSGYLTIELSPEIGENDGRPFTLDDLVLPYRMFSGYESDASK